MQVNIRKPQWLKDGRIDCEVEHPRFGWIPFTADPDDVEKHGRVIFELARDMKPVPVQEDRG